MSRHGKAHTLAAAMLLASTGVAHGLGGGPTGCYHLCPNDWVAYANGGGDGRCVVVGTTQTGTQPIQVTAGSIIDCDQLDVEVTGRDIQVTDGKFWLRARSVLVQGKAITAACGSHGDRHGFKLDVSGDIVVGEQGKLEASCNAGGGEIVLIAGDAVTLGGKDVTANGNGARGGRILVQARGDVTTSVDLQAANLGSNPGDGGTVDVSGDAVAIDAPVDVKGQAAEGGVIALTAAGGGLTVDGELDASCGNCDGGAIKIEVAGPMVGLRKLKAEGASATGIGGLIEVAAESLSQNGDVVATGGISGGTIQLEALSGTMVLGQVSSTLLDVRRNSSNPGDGGAITVRSLCDDVTLGSYADLNASGAGSGGEAGAIEVSGVDLVTAAASHVRADGLTSGTGGEVVLRAAGSMTLNGSVTANGGGAIQLLYGGSAPGGAGVPCPCGSGGCGDCEQIPDPPGLSPACAE